MHQPVAGQVPEVAQRLVAGVEQPEFHQLVRGDVVDQQHTCIVERWTPVGERVLQHPRGERFGHHRPLVGDAELVLQRGDHRRGGDRGDPVHHRVREADIGADPLRQRRPRSFGVCGEGVPGHFAVTLDVVAGHDRRRGYPAVTPSRQCLGHQAEHVHLAGPDGVAVQIDVVAALGDGQRNDPGARGGQQFDDGLGVVGRVLVVDDRADHPGVAAPVRMHE